MVVALDEEEAGFPQDVAQLAGGICNDRGVFSQRAGLVPPGREGSYSLFLSELLEPTTTASLASSLTLSE